MKLGIAPSTRPEIPHFPAVPLDQDSFYLRAGLFLVSPNTSDVQTIMDEALAMLETGNGNTSAYTYMVFPTAAQAEDYYRDNYDILNPIAGVNFNGSLSNMNYTIRMGYAQLPSTNSLYTGRG